MKDVQTTGEAFSPPKGNIKHLKNVLPFFYICGVIFALLDRQGPHWIWVPIRIWIRIHNTVVNYVWNDGKTAEKKTLCNPICQILFVIVPT